MRIKHGEMTLKKQEQKQHKHQQNYRPNQWSIAAVFLSTPEGGQKQL